MTTIMGNCGLTLGSISFEDISVLLKMCMFCVASSQYLIFSPTSTTAILLQGRLRVLLDNTCWDAWSRLARVERPARAADIEDSDKKRLLKAPSALDKLPGELLTEVVKSLDKWREVIAFGLTAERFWATAVYIIREGRFRTGASLAGERIACIGTDTDNMPAHLADVDPSGFSSRNVRSGVVRGSL
jgi:hypothetical protein